MTEMRQQDVEIITQFLIAVIIVIFILLIIIGIYFLTR